jgi:hypothetical protein
LEEIINDGLINIDAAKKSMVWQGNTPGATQAEALLPDAPTAAAAVQPKEAGPPSPAAQPLIASQAQKANSSTALAVTGATPGSNRAHRQHQVPRPMLHLTSKSISTRPTG